MIELGSVHVETKDVDGNTSFENEQTSYLTSVFEKHLSDKNQNNYCVVWFGFNFCLIQ